MAAEVKLPLMGSVSRRSLLIGGGLVAVVVGVMFWRNRSTSGGEELPAEDLEPTAEDLSGLGSGGGFGGAGGGSTVGAGGTTIEAAPAPVVTNAQWVAVAREALAGIVDESQLSAALGRYLAGSAIAHGSLDESLIEQARAAAGEPPQDGANGYPPAIRYQPATGQTPTPEPTPTPAPGPSTATLAAPTGLKGTGVTRQTARLSWNPVKGAVAYSIGRGTGTTPVKVTGTSAVVTNAKPEKTLFYVNVSAIDASGRRGKSSPTITVKLPAK